MGVHQGHLQQAMAHAAAASKLVDQRCCTCSQNCDVTDPALKNAEPISMMQNYHLISSSTTISATRVLQMLRTTSC